MIGWPPTRKDDSVRQLVGNLAADPPLRQPANMDCLDTSLHQQILSALAGNLASTSSQDDLSLLTQSFSSVQPAQNGQINGIVSRLEPGQATDGAEVIVRYISCVLSSNVDHGSRKRSKRRA